MLLHEKQRKALGVPAELSNSPLIYFSSHSGVHIEASSFLKALSTDDHNRKSSIIDLTTISPQAVIEELTKLFKSSDVPASKVMFNIIFLPALDKDGNSNKSSATIAVDRLNYTEILPMLKQFLLTKLDLKGSQDIQRISDGTTRLLEDNLPE
jgi:hypothetical protein